MLAKIDIAYVEEDAHPGTLSPLRSIPNLAQDDCFIGRSEWNAKGGDSDPVARSKFSIGHETVGYTARSKGGACEAEALSEEERSERKSTFDLLRNEVQKKRNVGMR